MRPSSSSGIHRGPRHERRFAQQLLGELQRVGGILVTESSGEGRVGKVPCYHSRRMAEDLRTRSHAALDSFEHKLHVKAGLFGDRKPFG